MNTKLKLLIACVALAAMPMTLTACGPQCGEDTVEKDGVCMPKDEFATCGQGTTLRDGSCILDTSGCGTGTALNDEGVCSPASQACGAGSIFENGQCVIDPTEDIECGENTVKDGTTCKPDPTALCQTGTLPDDTGRCVVATEACGAGTALDAATAKCTLADAACGANTVLANGACVPQDSACAAGTVFNTDTSTCLPEAVCKMGDVILTGTCVSPAEALLETPDFMQAPGFDDPELENGMPAQITLKPKGEQIVVVGTIDPPVDEDGDMEPDQDRDYFQAQLTQGQVIELTAQSVGGAPVGVSVAYEGVDENDDFTFVRFAPFGQQGGTARSFIVPKDGTYTFNVAPEPAFLLADDLLQGSADWQYVLTLEEKDWPAATMAGMTPLESMDVTDLSTSVYTLDDYAMPQPLSFAATELGAGVLVANVSIWKSPTEFVAEGSLEAGESSFQFLPMGPVYAVVDYTVAIGSSLNYTITPETPMNYQDIGTVPVATDVATPGTLTSPTPVSLSPETDQYWSVAGNPGEFIAISYEYGTTTFLPTQLTNGGVTLYDDNMDPTNDNFPSSAQWLWSYVSANDPNYILRINNTSTFSTRSDINVTAESHAVPPVDMVAVGETRTSTDATELEGSRWRLLSYGFATPVRLLGELEDNNGSDDLDMIIYDVATQQVVTSLETSGDEDIKVDLPAGDYVFAVKTADEDEVGNGHNLNFEVFEPPVAEIEPNDTDMMATPWDVTKAAAGQFKAGDTDFWSMSPPADLAMGEIAVLRVTPDIATGDMPVYQCSVTGPNGLIEGLTGARNECVIYLTDLKMADTYTVSVTTSEMADTNYEMTIDIVNGALSNGANSTMAMAQDLGMLTFGTATPAPLFGEVSGDGAVTTEEWYSFNLTADLNISELLSVRIEDVYNRAPSDIVVDILNAGNSSVLTAPFDLTTGRETLSGLSAGQYFIHVTRTALDASATGRFKLSMNTFTGLDFSNAPAATIVDNTVPGTIDVITVPGSPACTIGDILVPIDIAHNWRGDVLLTLKSPAGTVVTLHDETGGSADDIIGIYGVDLTSAQSLSAFVGETVAGPWEIEAADTAGGIDGTLNSWGLNFQCQ